MRKVPTKFITFDCPAELIEELDSLAESHMMERTDLILMAFEQLLTYMEKTRMTESPEILDQEDIALPFDLDLFAAPPEAVDGNVEVFDEWEDGLYLFTPESLHRD